MSKNANIVLRSIESERNSSSSQETGHISKRKEVANSSVLVGPKLDLNRKIEGEPNSKTPTGSKDLRKEKKGIPKTGIV